MSVYVDDVKKVGRKESLAPMLPTLATKIELEDPKPPIDQVYLDALKEQPQLTKKRSGQKLRCFERWIFVVDVLSPSNRTGGDPTSSQSQFEPHHSTDFVPPNINISNNRFQLFVFEDTEAVIKMIIPGRRLSMCQVSGMHRVHLAWSVDTFNLDSDICIRYVNTKEQNICALRVMKFHSAALISLKSSRTQFILQVPMSQKRVVS